MPKLQRLIEGQNIAFDTHQAGDCQEMNVGALHLEKRLHNSGGKIRFPLFGDINQPDASSNVNDDKKKRIINEVKRTLKKNPSLTQELAETVFSELERFSNGNSTIEDCEKAAKNIARYFNLNENFIDIVSKLKEDKLISFMTLHRGAYSPKKLYIIKQSKDEITIYSDWNIRRNWRKTFRVLNG